MRGYIVLIAALLFGVAFAVKLMCSGITLQLMPPALTNAIEGVAHVAAGDEAFQKGEYAKAEEEYLAALKDGDKLGFLTGGPGQTLHKLGTVYAAWGKYAEAEAHFEKALNIREKARVPNNPEVAETLTEFGRLRFSQGKYADAEALFQRALNIREKGWGARGFEEIPVLVGLASVKYTLGKYAEAEDLLGRAADILEQALEGDDPQWAGTLFGQARLHQERGNYAEAERLFRRELKITELRRSAEKQLGGKFDIRDFHDVILRNGALPLEMLEEQVAAYIRKK